MMAFIFNKSTTPVKFSSAPIGITIGRNEVTEILGWDAKNQAIYYMSAPEDRPGQRHLYKIVLEFQVLDSTSSDINIRPKTQVTYFL